MFKVLQFYDWKNIFYIKEKDYLSNFDIRYS